MSVKMRILLLILAFSTQLLAQVMSVDWHCPNIFHNESSVQYIPERQFISVRLDQDSFKLEPDIFESKKFSFSSFNTLFGGTKYVPNIANCLKNFKKSFVEKIARSKICPSDRCKGVLAQRFSNYLDQKELVKLGKDTTRLPSIYSGHTFSNDSETNYKKLLKNFCDGKTFSATTLTSRSFLQYAKNTFTNPLVNISASCINKLEELTKKYEFKGSCSKGDICSQIKADTHYFRSELSDLKNKEILEIPEIDSGAYIIAKSDTSALAGHFFKDVEHLNNGDCFLKKAQKKYKLESLFFYDNIISDAMPFIKDTFGKKCVKRFLETYLTNKYINSPPSPICLSRQCKEARQAQYLFEENIQDLLRIFYDRPFNLKACIQKIGANIDNAKAKLEGLLKDIESAYACAPLKMGEVKVVSPNKDDVGGNYALKKIGKNKLEATIAVDFSGGNAYNPALSLDLFDKTKSCLEQVGPYLKSPSGEQLSVKIIDKYESLQLPVEKRPDLQTIKIEPSDYRSKSAAYAKDINCETITHEVLHILGLHDEYKENSKIIYINTKTGKAINSNHNLQDLKNRGLAKEHLRYQCRAIADRPSIMSRHWEMFDETVGRKHTCRCNGPQCKQILTDGKRALELYTEGLWSSLNKRKSICDYTLLRTYEDYQFNRLEDTPKFKVIRDNDKELVFQHTDFIRLETDIFANIYEYTCKECRSKEECNDLEKLRSRVTKQIGAKLNTCPTGSTPLETKYLPRSEASQKVEVIDSNTFSFTSQPMNPSKSLLHPSHFARIKHGACSSRVQKYSICAKYAYKDINPQDCPDRPNYCNNPEKWLMEDK